MNVTNFTCNTMVDGIDVVLLSQESHGSPVFQLSDDIALNLAAQLVLSVASRQGTLQIGSDGNVISPVAPSGRAGG